MLSDSYLQKLWCSYFVELYCCACFNALKFERRKLENEKAEKVRKMKPKEQLRFLLGNNVDIALVLKIKTLDKF